MIIITLVSEFVFAKQLQGIIIDAVWLIFTSLTDFCKRNKQTQDKSGNKSIRRQHFA